MNFTMMQGSTNIKKFDNLRFFKNYRKTSSFINPYPANVENMVRSKECQQMADGI
jgi:hypothetical protein